jgi:hypothetical protein
MLARTKCATNWFADKGQLAPQTDRLYTVMQMLVLADTTAPHSRVGRVVQGCRSDRVRERGIGQYKAARKIAIVRDLPIPVAHPHPRKIFDDTIIPS